MLQDVAKEYGSQGFPTLLAFKDGAFVVLTLVHVLSVVYDKIEEQGSRTCTRALERLLTWFSIFVALLNQQ